jgi:hypothetical protein
MMQLDNLNESITEFLRQPPFSLKYEEKNLEFLDIVNNLTIFHRTHCASYERIVGGLFGDELHVSSLEKVPYIPVRLFKSLQLQSVNNQEIMKTMTSSGTSGQAVSQIYLDKPTSAAQTRALTQIMGSLLGKSRHPMLIIDSSSVIKNRDMFSARGAGIRGFSMFGKDVEYMFDENMDLRIVEIEEFLSKHRDEKIFLFGFTFMIWEHLCEVLRLKKKSLQIPNGLLLHGGGWKKLAALNIQNEDFKNSVFETTQIKNVVNYYGMVEQTGSIFVECEAGFLHSSNYSEIIVRDPTTLQCAPDGVEGVIQLISVLPMSYPGHSILTEDVGVVVGADDCSCARPGRYFRINGRIKDAEVRGCSDTYSV